MELPYGGMLFLCFSRTAALAGRRRHARCRTLHRRHRRREVVWKWGTMPVTKTYRFLAARHRRRRRAGLLGWQPAAALHNEARRAIPASTMFVGRRLVLPRPNGDLSRQASAAVIGCRLPARILFGAANEWAVRRVFRVGGDVVAVPPIVTACCASLVPGAAFVRGADPDRQHQFRHGCPLRADRDAAHRAVLRRCWRR